MEYTRIYWPDLHVTAMVRSFVPAGADAEFHAVIEPDAVPADTEKQYEAVAQAALRLGRLPELKGATPVWKRFFASDASGLTPPKCGNEAVSLIVQPPLGGAKVALWIYFVQGAKISGDGAGVSVMRRPGYNHIYHTQLHRRGPAHIGEQTTGIFDDYTRSLARHGCTLERNCVRTWIFVTDVDRQYAGMVTARRELFEREGLTPHTHYIASTGIEGGYIHPDVRVLMDACAVSGIVPFQIEYLKAPSHLNPTYEYGVTFERGTVVTYGDRRHIFISGTASIDNRGEIVYPGDVAKQTERAFENVRALLAEAGTGMGDVASMIVYLRNGTDHATVSEYVERHHPDIPHVTVLAPVCRPGWLVEVECMAVVPAQNNSFAPF